MAGVNHFAWVLGFQERATGRDLMPELRQRVASGFSGGMKVAERLLRETGYLLMPHDHHTRDFLPPGLDTPRTQEPPYHGDEQERTRRIENLKAVAEGRMDWSELVRHGAWERPVDFIAALAFGKTIEFHALDLPNQGQVDNLPRRVFVETPCVVDAGRIAPDDLTLPAPVLPYCQLAAQVTDAIVQAGMARSRRLVHAAVELDPTVLDKKAGIAAIDECLAAHAGMLPSYA